MAVGISCAGTGSRAAMALLEPLQTDATDFVRQGALIASALVLIEQPESSGVEKLRKHLETTIAGTWWGWDGVRGRFLCCCIRHALSLSPSTSAQPTTSLVPSPS